MYLEIRVKLIDGTKEEIALGLGEYLKDVIYDEQDDYHPEIEDVTYEVKEVK